MLASHATQIGHASLLIIDFIVLVSALYFLAKSQASPASQNRMVFLAIASFAIIGRWVMEPLPNIQPVTILVLVGGIILGARRGIALALIITLVSNILLGSGLWTVFQAIGWSLVAVVGATFADKFTEAEGKINLLPVLIVGFASGIVFNWIVSFSVLPNLADGGAFIDYLIIGLPYDLMHAFGNFTMALWLVPIIHHLLYSNSLNTSETSHEGTTDSVVNNTESSILA